MSSCPLDSLSRGLLIQVRTVKVGLFGRPLYPKNTEAVFSSVLCCTLTLYSRSQNFDAFPRYHLSGAETILVINSQDRQFLG